jgi:ribulose-phosphate 3-epimerase
MYRAATASLIFAVRSPLSKTNHNPAKSPPFACRKGWGTLKCKGAATRPPKRQSAIRENGVPGSPESGAVIEFEANVLPTVEIAPSILAADFASLGDAIRAVEGAGVSMLHVDVMDGHFVPNISIGVPVVASLRKATRLTLDVHLMIENPEQYIEAFAHAGADMISVHQEATPHLNRTLAMIRENHCRPGAVINPATPVSMLSEVLGRVDHVLVMSVNPGFGGQAFIPEAVEKIRQLRQMRERYNHNFRIAVDGGIGPDNVAEVVRAGAQILVAGTSVFHTPDPGAAVRSMVQLATEALTQRV